MNFHILTLFPDMVMQGLLTSITGRAAKQGKINIDAVNIRDFTEDKHRKVDDYPYGGGAGMLMQAQPVYDAWKHVTEAIDSRDSAQAKKRVVRTIYVTPQGTPFSQKAAEEFSMADDLILLCGHYEGIDERVLEEVVTDYVSIGDYVLTGGELAAMVIVDAVARLVPGVLNNEDSAQTESFHGNLLEYPQYSRPEVWHGKEVPEVLLSGNQSRIDLWRKEQSVLRTKERRPDLYEAYQKLEECRNRMMKQKLLHIDMIELINRGRALLLCGEEGNILLRDRLSGICFYTNLSGKPDGAFTEMFGQLPEDVQKAVTCLVVHQKETVQEIRAMATVSAETPCYQQVYTRREKLPVRGLYCPDGKESASGLSIRLITEEEGRDFLSEYEPIAGPEDFLSRCRAKAVYGAFVHGTLAAVAGVHEEGSLGMLYVKKAFRRGHIAMAIETYLINQAIEWGWIPYGQVVVGNEASLSLQEKLGLYRSKELIVWMDFHLN